MREKETDRVGMDVVELEFFPFQSDSMEIELPRFRLPVLVGSSSRLSEPDRIFPSLFLLSPAPFRVGFRAQAPFSSPPYPLVVLFSFGFAGGLS